MFHRENIKKHNTAKIMAETFGRYNIFATLSLSLSLSLSQVLTYSSSHIIKIRGRPRVNIRLFLRPCKRSRIVFCPRRTTAAGDKH